ncbi:MAG: acetyl-CoA carboxylase biotin carboxyl carrier protein subunit [Clostridia bacterium]|nr:acetyl-CoA carboxylase biotin carboxyl carrier protein subunit [Clostridia bacterium]
MTNKEVFELIDRFERGSIRSLRLSMGGVTLEMSKDGAMGAAPAAVAAAPVGEAKAQNAPALAADACEKVTAPLAGVFYEASAPGAEPYVRVGDRVKAGDTLCLMEAMKMISEVPAPCDCIITHIYKENGALCGYGEALLGYKPC